MYQKNIYPARIQNCAPDPAPDAAAVPAAVATALWGGLSLLALAGLAVAAAWPVGSWQRPGPGGFAMVVLALLAAIALPNLLISWRRLRLVGDAPRQDVTVKAMQPLLVLAGPALFALTAQPLGVVAAGALTAFVAGLATGVGPARAALAALVLTGAAWVLFRHGLSIPFDWRGGWFA
jgi:hypothetical protein